jgi:hypothetical protein
MSTSRLCFTCSSVAGAILLDRVGEGEAEGARLDRDVDGTRACD